MNKIFKHFISTATALTVACTSAAVLPMSLSADEEAPISAAVEKSSAPIFTSEAENCEITSGGTATDNVYGTKYAGCSGDKFVWAGNSGGVKFDVTLTEGAMYEISTRCWMYLGEIGSARTQNVAIDGKQVASLSIPNSGDWKDYSFGYVYLEAGTHTIEIGSSGSWGFILYDTVTFDYADMPDLSQADAVPSDPKATPETKALMSYLQKNYGKNIISGQQETYGGGNDGDTELEFEYIFGKTGKYPVIRGFDMMNYNPIYGWDDGSTGRAIQWVAQRGGIATTSWHINVPINFDTYEVGDAVDWKDATYKPTPQFKTANCLDKTTKEYAYLMAAIDDLAEQLLKLQDANVPIILRPFHEAEGNNNTDGSGAWFWWGSAGSEVYKQLWKLLYTTLTEKGVHNCIYELNLYSYADSAEWYPGDDCVDMVAYDKYEGSPYTWGTNAATTVFLSLVNHTNNTKMVSLAECDKIPDITNMKNEGAWWSYFCPWYGNFITDGTTNTPELLDEVYNSENVITLDEVPNDIYGYERGNGGNWNVDGAYECETGTVGTNNGSKIVDYKYCSGTGYVYLQGADDYIEQTVTVDKDGIYNLKYGYQQNFESAGKTQNLYVNGKSVGEAFFPYAILFGETESIPVELKAGTNTIKLESVEGWTYLDYLTVTSAEEVEVVKGDINADGKVTAADLLLLKKYVLGAGKLTKAQAERAELSGDEKIDSSDIVMLKKIMTTK